MDGDTPSQQPARRTAVAGCLVALFATLVAYIPVLSADFVYDDLVLITQNQSIRSFSNIGSWFSSSFWRDVYNPADADHIPYYRPVVTCLLAIGHLVSGSDPAGYHIINLLFHLGNTALVFVVMRRAAGVCGATIAAGAFGLFPSHTENVAWMSGISDVSATFFGLLASLGAMNASDALAAAGPKPRLGLTTLLILSPLSALAAFLAKESALTLPAALLIFHFFTSPHRLFATLAPWTLFLIPGIVYYYLRVAVFGPAAGFDLIQTEFHFSPWRYASLRHELFRDYCGTLLNPFDLNAFRTTRVDVTEGSAFVRNAWIASTAITGCTALLAALSAAVRHMRLPLACVLAVFLTIAPQIASPRSLGHYVFADRYLYIPSIGYCLLLGAIAHIIAIRFSRTAAVSGIILCVAFFISTFERVPVWKNEWTLFRQSALDSPDSVTVKCALGRLYLSRYQNGGTPADLESSLTHFQGALNQDIRDRVYVSNQDVVQSYLGISSIRMIQGKTEEALSIYDQVIEQYPSNDIAWMLSGIALAQLGNANAAEERFRKAIALRPTFSEAYYNLGNLYLTTGQAARAIPELRTALKIAPSGIQAALLLATALVQNHEPNEAARLLDDTLNKNPDFPGANRLREMLAKITGK